MNCINHPDRPRIAFCQNCGKPLCAECARVVGSAVFDEPCLAERLAASQPIAGQGSAAPFGTGPTTTAYQQHEPGPDGRTPYAASGTGEGIPYSVPGAIPRPGAPNPGLAALLGFIPGVGAMYNGQYAKGVVHLIVFAVLVSLADQHGIFGLFITGWVFYQVFEAYHTAKARRDGTPLPNPFGLNDLGERLGFGKAWGAVPPVGGTPAGGSGGPFSSTPPPNVGGAYQAPPPAPDAGAFAGNAAYSAPAGSPYTQSYAGAAPYSAASAPVGSPWGSPVENDAAFSPVPPAAPANFAGTSNRFPMGAIILIGLGLLFLIGNAGWIEGFPVYRLYPFLLIGLAVWLFVRRMLDTGPGLGNDGTPGYQIRLVRALRSSMWIFVVGVLAFLDSFRILSWGRSWPLFIIAAGLFAFLQRSAFAAAAQPAYPAYPASPIPPSGPVAEPVPSTVSVVPVDGPHRSGEEL